MSEPGPQSTPGEEIRTVHEALNRRLAALGVYTMSRYDKSPRLGPGDWEKLVALAELGRERQAASAPAKENLGDKRRPHKRKDKRMQKIPTLFVRDFDHDPRYVTRDVTPGCEWVLKGEGTPTRKYDGTCVMFDGADWWARREVKPGKAEPDNFVYVSADPETGKTAGWEPAGQSSFAKYHAEALRNGTAGDLGPGTYELCGPKVNGNPEAFVSAVLVPHAEAQVLSDVPLDFDALAIWLHAHPYEGIVWHHEDGRMAKLKARDFPR